MIYGIDISLLAASLVDRDYYIYVSLLTSSDLASPKRLLSVRKQQRIYISFTPLQQ